MLQGDSANAWVLCLPDVQDQLQRSSGAQVPWKGPPKRLDQGLARGVAAELQHQRPQPTPIIFQPPRQLPCSPEAEATHENMMRECVLSC